MVGLGLDSVTKLEVTGDASCYSQDVEGWWLMVVAATGLLKVGSIVAVLPLQHGVLQLGPSVKFELPVGYFLSRALATAGGVSMGWLAKAMRDSWRWGLLAPWRGMVCSGLKRLFDQVAWACALEARA